MWYAKVQVTDLSSVVHDISPGILGSGDALKVSLENGVADDFTFSLEDYDGTKRTWLERGCIVEIFIDTFKPPTTRRLYGMVEEVRETWPLPATIVVEVTGRDVFHIYLDRKVTETYLNKEVSLIVADLLTKYAPTVNQFDIDVTTTTLDDARFPYRSLSEVLDYLTTVSGFTYRCIWPDFYWKAAKTEDSGVTYDQTDLSPGAEKLSSLYSIKNRVYVLGGYYYEVDKEQLVHTAAVNTKDYWYAQSFTPQRSDLDQISLYLKRTLNPANLEGEIRTDSAGPDAKVATFSIDKDFVETAASWRPTRIEATLLIGVKYWIVLQVVGDVTDYYEWYHDNLAAGENAYSVDGLAWTVQAASYQMAYKTHYKVPVLAAKQNYASSGDYMWREYVHRDEAIVTGEAARATAQALLDEMVDETPNIKNLETVNQAVVPDRGKLVTITLAPLGITAVQYVVQTVSFSFPGGQDGVVFMDVGLGRSAEELAEWLNRLRLDIDRTKIGSFGVDMGLVNLVEAVGPDTATALDAVVATELASGSFKIEAANIAKIAFSDVA
jgi:hypothetical protein